MLCILQHVKGKNCQKMQPFLRIQFDLLPYKHIIILHPEQILRIMLSGVLVCQKCTKRTKLCQQTRYVNEQQQPEKHSFKVLYPCCTTLSYHFLHKFVAMRSWRNRWACPVDASSPSSIGYDITITNEIEVPPLMTSSSMDFCVWCLCSSSLETSRVMHDHVEVRLHCNRLWDAPIVH